MPTQRPTQSSRRGSTLDATISSGRNMRESVTFGRMLRQHRLDAGLTQEALARRAGLSLRGLSDLERGARRYPRPVTVQRLAVALRLSDAELEALMLVRHRPANVTLT